MIFLTTLHDPHGIFLNHIAKLDTEFFSLFEEVFVVCTNETNSELIKFLKSKNANVISGGAYSESKIKGLKKAYRLYPKETFFYCDFDKTILWYSQKKFEFKSIVFSKYHSNYVMIGRNETTFSTYPQSWIKTEKITNKCLSTAVQMKNIDALTATCLFDSSAAKIITHYSRGKEWESPVEWPLLVKKNNLKIEYKSASGMLWEDPYFYYNKKKHGKRSKWKNDIYDSPHEWIKRLTSSLQQITVIKFHSN